MQNGKCSEETLLHKDLILINSAGIINYPMTLNA